MAGARACAVVISAVVLLLPVLASAQARAGSSHRGMSISVGSGGGVSPAAGAPRGGYGFGLPAGNLGRVAPHPGFGNVNHPGLGYSPNTPGVGYPVGPGIQPLPTTAHPAVGPIRPGATVYGGPPGYRNGYDRYGHRHGYGCRHTGYGYPVVYGVPVAVPIYADYGGFTYTSTTGYAQANPGAPTVIIIQQPPAPQQAPQTAPQQGGPYIYETRPPQAEEKPAQPLTLLVFKDHSIVAATKYWKEGDRLHFITSSGAQNSVSVDFLDLEFTKRLNAERNVKFEL